jgi:hypothetical protein
VEVLTTHEITSAAGVTLAAVTAMPSHPDPLAFPPNRDTGTNSIDHACDLMARHARVIEAGPMAFLCKGVAMADSAGLYFDANRIRTRFGHRPFHDLKWTAWTTDLHGHHL